MKKGKLGSSKVDHKKEEYMCKIFQKKISYSLTQKLIMIKFLLMCFDVLKMSEG